MGDTEVIFYDQGSNKLAVVKFIKVFLNIGLAEAKEICDGLVQAPKTFTMYGAEASDFTSGLQKLGAKVEKRPLGASTPKASSVMDEIDLIKELVERIEALEWRIAKLENTATQAASMPPTAQPQLTGKVLMDDFPFYLCSNYWRPLTTYPTVVLSDGRRGYIKPIKTNDGNFTVGQTRKVADMFGYKYDSKTKREALGWELVSKYGDGKWAFIGTKAVNDNGVTYDFIETSKLYDPEALAFASNKKINYNNLRFVNCYKNEPFTTSQGWTEQQIHDNLVTFIKSLVEK